MKIKIQSHLSHLIELIKYSHLTWCSPITIATQHCSIYILFHYDVKFVQATDISWNMYSYSTHFAKNYIKEQWNAQITSTGTIWLVFICSFSLHFDLPRPDADCYLIKGTLIQILSEHETVNRCLFFYISFISFNNNDQIYNNLTCCKTSL